MISIDMKTQLINCIKCGKEIPNKMIPKESLQKIGMQMYWHEDCSA